MKCYRCWWAANLSFVLSDAVDIGLPDPGFSERAHVRLISKQ